MLMASIKRGWSARITEKQPSSSITWYQIRVAGPRGEGWSLRRRLKDFKDLDASFRARFLEGLPPLPSRGPQGEGVPFLHSSERLYQLKHTTGL